MTEKQVNQVLHTAAEKGVFSQWYAACCSPDGIAWQSRSDAGDISFDLASLTKPFVTGLGWSHVFADGIVGPEWELGQRLPVAARKGRLQVWHLLAHWAGLRAYDHQDLPAVLAPHKRWQWIEERWPAWQQEPPGTRQLYSDLGYLVAGEILAEIRGRPLSAIWQQSLVRLGLSVDVAVQYPTDEPWAHDPMARAFCGICGHAGLWGTGPATVQVVQALLRAAAQDPAQWPGIWAVPDWAPASTYTLGFDTPTGSSTAGADAPQDTIGHLAFSGCSFWLSPQQNRATVLLTNRGDCLADPAGLVLTEGESAEMFAVRQAVHSAGWF